MGRAEDRPGRPSSVACLRLTRGRALRNDPLKLSILPAKPARLAWHVRRVRRVLVARRGAQHVREAGVRLERDREQLTFPSRHGALRYADHLAKRGLCQALLPAREP